MSQSKEAFCTEREKRNVRKPFFHVMFWLGEASFRMANEPYLSEKKKCPKRTVCSDVSTFSQEKSERRAKEACCPYGNSESFRDFLLFLTKLEKLELLGPARENRTDGCDCVFPR